MMQLTIQDIINQLGCQKFEGNAGALIEEVIQFDEKNQLPTVLMWVNEKHLSKLSELNKGTVICPNRTFEKHPDCNYLMVSHPRRYFAQVLQAFFVEKRTPSIATSATIAETAIIGKEVSIGHNVVIEENCRIGAFTQIDHNTIIKSGSIIGEKVTIGANNTIGGVGFGYEKDESGIFTQIPHIGNVLIEDFVEIGNNNCIDRAVLGSTILKKHCKIDNLVHIAHGVEIGENALVIANAMIAGSTKIGENAWIAPSASILNKRIVGDDAIVGMGSVILKDVPAGDTVAGVPGKSIK